MSVADNIIEFPDWKRHLARRKNGEPYANEANVMLALEHSPEVRGIFEYDDFHDLIRIRGELPDLAMFADAKPRKDILGDEHITWITAWLQDVIPTVKRDHIQTAIIAVSKSRSVHPVRAWLKALKWDGQPRLDDWLITYCTAKDNPAYLRSVGPKFMIGAVARVMQPGCQMDTMLVLEGGQGIGKSTAVRILANHWAADITGELASKDAAIHIQGVWLGEMSELSSIRRSDQETIKGFVSRRIDRYRPPYGRTSIDRPRQTVFVATTNESDYLQDPTGARRFWPADCGAVRMTELERDRGQLWAEAAYRYTQGERWHLDAVESRQAQIEQEARQRVSPLEATVLDYADSMKAAGHRKLEMREMLIAIFECNSREDPQKASGLAQQIARALTRDGWKRAKPTGYGRNRKQFYEWVEAGRVETSQGSQGPAASQGSQSSQGDFGGDDEIF